MNRFFFGVAALVAAGSTASATSYTINFDQDANGNAIANGSTASNQYAAWGVSFTPNAFAGGNWATNTGMTITSTDTGIGYDPSLGQILHAYNADWLTEDGDPSFLMTFSTPIDSISMDVIGDTGGLDGFQTVLVGFDITGTVQTGFAEASGIGGIENIGASFSADTYFVAVAHGEFFDWVGIDNIKFNTVPTPGAMAVLGLGGLVAGRRRR